MTARAKFILLLVGSFSFFTLSFMLFMKSDFAQNELTYFRTYPYQEMASRHKKPSGDTVIVKTRTQLPPIVTNVQTVKTTPVQPSPQIPLSGRLMKERKQAYLLPKKPPQLIRDQQKSENISITTLPKKEKTPRPKKSWRLDAERGYAAYNDKQYDAAIKYFEQALKQAPDQQKIRLQLAYANKISGRNKKAIKYFKQVIDQHDNIMAFPLKREVEQLENHFDINGYAIYRGKSFQSSSVTGVDLTQSQVGLELSYQPENIGYQNGRTLQIYGRLLSAMKQGNISPDPDSYQAGFGLRWKPLPSHNLVISAERLQKVGNFARSDWMIRVGYSRDYGTDYRADRTGWWSHSLYLDAALIEPDSPDIYLTGQVYTGYNIKLLQRFVIQPRLTILASWQQDSFQQAGLIEAGPGLNLRFYFNDTKYEAYRSYIDLTMEYRLKLSGNSIGGSGPVMGLILHF